MSIDDRRQAEAGKREKAMAGNFGNQSFLAQRNGAMDMLMGAGQSRDEAKKTLSNEPLWGADKYQGMSKNDAQFLREDWMKTQAQQMHQAKLDALRGPAKPPPASNAPPPPPTPGPPGPPSAAPGGVIGAPVGATQPMAPPVGGIAPPQGDNYQAQQPNMNDQVMAAPDPVRDTGYSRWSQMAPQLAVQAEATPMVTYDTSHLNRKAPLKSAGELFTGATDTSRALRSDIMSKYSGGQDG